MPISISRILVPVDFSRRAEGAVRSAYHLAGHFGAEVILLHVVEPFHVDFAMVEPFEASLRELAQASRARNQAKLDEFAIRIHNGTVPVKRQIAEGDPAVQILECSQSTNSDLILMPTQGHGRLRGLLIGSVTAKVLDESERPVLTGTHVGDDNDSAKWQFRRILCAIDLGARSASVLGWGKSLAEEFQAKLTVLHVSSDSGAEARLAEAVEAAGIDAEARVRDGEPHKVVVETAGETKADLVIIGRGTATDTLGRLRAQAYGIVRQAPCPVLSV